jgi:hypothetical protein
MSDKRIDAQKLIDWLAAQEHDACAQEEKSIHHAYYKGKSHAFGDVIGEIESGTFDVQEIEQTFRQTLEFYADPATYDIDHLSKHGYIIIDRDGGKRARAVLESYPKEG